MQEFRQYFSKGATYNGALGATGLDIFAEKEKQIVLTNIVAFNDTQAPQRVRVWEVGQLEIEMTTGGTHRRLIQTAIAGGNIIEIDSITGIGIGSKIYIDGTNRSGYYQHIANVTFVLGLIPSGFALTIDQPLPYDFRPGDRVMLMTEQGNGLHCQPQTAVTAGELTLQGECLVAGHTKSPLHLEVYGSDSELFVAGYWYDNA